MFKIYLITNKINGKIYVGQTKKELRVRLRCHVLSALHGYTGHLGCAIRKHGADNFSIKFIDRAGTKEVSDWLEGQYISAFRSYDRQYGYNLTMGGEGTLGWNPSQSTREKISLSAIGRSHSEETKIKIREGNKGVKRSEETRKRMSEAAKKRSYNSEWARAIGRANKGRVPWNKGLKNGSI